MKNFLLIILLAIGVTACKKEERAQPTPGNPNPSVLNPYEQACQGNWIVRVTDTYSSNDSLLNHQVHTDTINCHLDLRDEQNSVNASTNSFDCTFALGCSAYEAGWKCNGSYLTLIGQQFYILQQTSDTLRIKSPGSGYYICLLTR